MKISILLPFVVVLVAAAAAAAAASKISNCGELISSLFDLVCLKNIFNSKKINLIQNDNDVLFETFDSSEKKV